MSRKTKLCPFNEVHENTKKKYKFTKSAPVMIDRTDFDFEGISFNYEELEGRFNKTGRKYKDIAIYINKEDLQKVLDEYHYDYLMECTNGTIWIDLLHLEKDHSDYDLYRSLKSSVKEVK